MAHWNPVPANDLVAFAAARQVAGPGVNAFMALVGAWADGLLVNSNGNFAFGDATAEVNADPGTINRSTFG